MILSYPENHYQQAAAKDDGCGDDNEEKYLNMKIEMEIKMKVKMMMEMSQYFLKVNLYSCMWSRQ